MTSSRSLTVLFLLLLVIPLAGAMAAEPIVELYTNQELWFDNGAGKVPKKITHGLVVLENHDPPLYVCY